MYSKFEIRVDPGLSSDSIVQVQNIGDKYRSFTIIRVFPLIWFFGFFLFISYHGLKHKNAVINDWKYNFLITFANYKLQT